ncbi:hypothetical protein AB1395_03765 [Streptococcus pluranimalium]|uniref:hypothetical protein n=1 Tax=Streptococcus pluranimalium TaxID=82348 RepID=UPI0034672E0F
MSELSTLDSSNISYYFEKALVENPQISNINNSEGKKRALIEEVNNNYEIPSNFEYLDSFYDKSTGTSGVTFKEMDTDKMIIAYTGTNPNFGDGGWKNVLDKNWWSEFFQKDVMKSDLAGIGFGTG